MKFIYPDRSTQKISYEQISFYLKQNLLITFQEGPQDAFGQIKSKSNISRTIFLFIVSSF